MSLELDRSRQQPRPTESDSIATNHLSARASPQSAAWLSKKSKIVYPVLQQCMLDSHNYSQKYKHKLDNKNIKIQLKVHKD